MTTNKQNEGTLERRGPSWLLKPIGAAAGAGAALALVPALVPNLAASLSATAPHAYWYISRASAFVAFALLWLSMLAGLGITGKLARFWPGLPGSFELHRFTALLGLGFGLVHALVLLGDQYINYTLPQLLVPFMSTNYKPEWVGFGQLAFYFLMVVSFSFYVRDRLGVHAWRLIHMLSFALFLMTLIHGLRSGTDSSTLWAQALYWISAASVLLGSIHRIFAARLGRPRTALSARPLVVRPGKGQLHPNAD
ncbi:MAG: hypothetical protein ACJ78Q_17845 [Chloroflexia bacterium]